jgi:hypothetical protein
LSQLHALFQTLAPQEISRLRSLRLIGKEREVFNLVMDSREGELPESDDLLEKLGITDSHYYKINSVLLRKSYQTLVPEEGAALLKYLKLKNLFHLLRHEILAQDKKLAARMTDEERKQFFLSAFHYFIDFPYKFYDKKLTDLFGQKYLSAIPNCPESDKAYVEYHKLFADVNRMAARKNPSKALGITIDELFNREDQLRSEGHSLALYYLYRAICSYYTYYEKDNERVIRYLEKASGLKNEIAWFFPIDIGQFLDLLYADALFRANKISRANEIYTAAFSKGVDESMYGYYYHCEQYVLVSIIMDNFSQALELLNRIFLPCINNKLDIYATRGAMCYVKLYLSNGELKQASHYLGVAKSINEKTFYLPFDVQLRVLENIYFFLKGDYDFALQLANRNIKFLRSQEQEEVLGDYLMFWKMMVAFLNAIFKETEVPAPIIKDYEYLSSQYANLYCNLFRLLYERTCNALA